MEKPTAQQCECEHIRHMGHDDLPEGHGYMNVPADESIKTPWGTFAVCYDCATMCYGEWR